MFLWEWANNTHKNWIIAEHCIVLFFYCPLHILLIPFLLFTNVFEDRIGFDPAIQLLTLYLQRCLRILFEHSFCRNNILCIEVIKCITLNLFALTCFNNARKPHLYSFLSVFPFLILLHRCSGSISNNFEHRLLWNLVAPCEIRLHYTQWIHAKNHILVHLWNLLRTFFREPQYLSQFRNLLCSMNFFRFIIGYLNWIKDKWQKKDLNQAYSRIISIYCRREVTTINNRVQKIVWTVYMTQRPHIKKFKKSRFNQYFVGIPLFYLTATARLFIDSSSLIKKITEATFPLNLKYVV